MKQGILTGFFKKKKESTLTSTTSVDFHYMLITSYYTMASAGSLANLDEMSSSLLVLFRPLVLLM
jgi:hypothetical protein